MMKIGQRWKRINWDVGYIVEIKEIIRDGVAKIMYVQSDSRNYPIGSMSEAMCFPTLNDSTSPACWEYLEGQDKP